MQLPFVILTIIILIIAGFSNAFRISGPTTKSSNNSSSTTTVNVFRPQPTPTNKPADTSSSRIDTIITAGPNEGETVSSATNQITFEFKGTGQLVSVQGGIYFETKVEGLDNSWTEVYTAKKTIDFPAGNQEYTFLARARSKDIIDETPAKRTFKFKTSPYFNKVKINNVSPASMTLSSNLSANEKVNLAGWKLQSKKGTININQGAKLYLPGGSSSQTDISLEQYGSVVFNDGQSPLGSGNKTFRPNKCFGYLQNTSSNLPYSYGKVCPQIKYEDVSRLAKTCQDYVRNLQNCNVLDYASNPISYDSNCVSFINNYTSKNLNYNGCVENYYNDKDFLNNTWYSYPGNNIFCDCNDFLYLYDAEGFLVDKYFMKSNF